MLSFDSLITVVAVFSILLLLMLGGTSYLSSVYLPKVFGFFVFIVQLTVFLSVLFNLNFLCGLDFNAYSENKQKYLYFVLVSLFLCFVYVVYWAFKPDVFKKINGYNLPFSYLGFEVFIYYLASPSYIALCKRLLFYLALDKNKHFLYYVFKVIVKFVIPFLGQLLFLFFVFDSISSNYLYYFIPLAFLAWFCRLLFQAYEQYVFESFGVLNEIISVSVTNHQPGSYAGIYLVDEIGVTLTQEGKTVGYSEEETVKLAQRWLLLASNKSNIEIFSARFGFMPNILFILRLILWALICFLYLL